jgi:hypothetical protein
VVDNRSRYGPFSWWWFYVVYDSDQICSFLWDRAGQLEESGEYRMRRLRVVCFYIRSFKCGSPRLCRLRIMSVGPCCNKHWVVYLCIRDLWSPAHLVVSTVAGLDDTPLYFTDDIGWYLGHLRTTRRGFHVEDGTRIRWTNSLIVITKGGHSCYLHGSHVLFCQVDTLQGEYWFESLWHPRIWVMLVRCVQT